MFNDKYISIYIHIPFCLKKCFYCDFCSYTNLNKIDEYLFYLKKEAKFYSEYFKDFKVKTFFVGGGTPTILKEDQINSTFSYIFSLFNISNDSEISCEANPETLNLKKLKSLKNIGFNRLSIGVQSLNDNVLKNIGRVHDAKTAIDSIEFAKKADFKNINVDLMYGLPGQDLDVHINTLNKIIDMKIKHISAYNLILEEGTKLEENYKSGKTEIPNEELQLEMYDATKNILEKHDFFQYEISNYAKKGFECKHNLVYWKREPYIGIGSSSHSFILKDNKEIRFYNPNNHDEHINNIKSNKYFNSIEYINYDDAIFEFVMLRLRLINGFKEDEFFKEFNISIWDYYSKTMETLIDEGLVLYNNGIVRLTQQGIKLQNYVLLKLAK